MPIDGFFVHHLVNELSPTVNNSLITKIYQPSKSELVFQIRNNYQNHQLYFNVDFDYPRVYLSGKKYVNPNLPFNFCMLLRKYLERGIIEKIEQVENDRVICLTINSYNEMEDSTSFKLIFELTGRNSNLVLVNSDDIIIDSIRKYPPSDTNSRYIIPKAKYLYPESKQINPFNASSDTYFNELEGCGKDLKNEFIYVNEFKSVILRETTPIIYKDKKDFFYCIKLHHKDNEFTTYKSLSEMLDVYFTKVEIQINEEANKLYKSVKREIDKRVKKLKKFVDELTSAKEKLQSKDYGVLLQSYLYLIKKGDKSITVNNFLDDNKEVTITLDETLDPVENLKQFFKQTKKAENACNQIVKQIQITKEEIEYLEDIFYQIKFLNIKEVEEVKNELINNKILFEKQKKNSNKKVKIQLASYNIENVEILIGKNNIQNNYLTNKFARPNDYWFHVKDMPGSHVIVRTTELNETIIRFAANLAACFSKGSISSSVPVDYTQVKFLKKIPGVKGYKVTYTNNKTIYIDPDINTINNYKAIYK